MFWEENDMSRLNLRFPTDHQSGGLRLAFIYKAREQVTSELLVNKILKQKKISQKELVEWKLKQKWSRIKPWGTLTFNIWTEMGG